MDPARTHPMPGAAPPQHPAGRVLIVDDEVTLAELLARGLGQRGYATAMAHSAEAARRLLAELPDVLVLLCDVTMPGEDGIALAGDLQRHRAEHDAIEIVLLTGNATAETARAATQAQVFDLVHKPFSLGRVTRTLNAALQHAAGRRARAAAPAPGGPPLSAAMRHGLRPIIAEAERLLADPGLPAADREAGLAGIAHRGRALLALLEAPPII